MQQRPTIVSLRLIFWLQMIPEIAFKELNLINFTLYKQTLWESSFSHHAVAMKMFSQEFTQTSKGQRLLGVVYFQILRVVWGITASKTKNLPSFKIYISHTQYRIWKCPYTFLFLITDIFWMVLRSLFNCLNPLKPYVSSYPWLASYCVVPKEFPYKHDFNNMWNNVRSTSPIPYKINRT